MTLVVVQMVKKGSVKLIRKTYLSQRRGYVWGPNYLAIFSAERALLIIFKNINIIEYIYIHIYMDILLSTSVYVDSF